MEARVDIKPDTKRSKTTGAATFYRYDDSLAFEKAKIIVDSKTLTIQPLIKNWESLN